jgi:predicted aspartyl protease
LEKESPSQAPVAPSTATAGEIDVALRSTSGGLASAETSLPNLTRPLNFILDTGATVTVISKAAVKRFELDPLKIQGETYRVIGAAGIEEGAEALALTTLTVSGLRKKNARALILDLEPVNETSGFEQHGIIGGDYLVHFKVDFDLRRFRLRLTPQSGAITIAADK